MHRPPNEHSTPREKTNANVRSRTIILVYRDSRLRTGRAAFARAARVQGEARAQGVLQGVAPALDETRPVQAHVVAGQVDARLLAAPDAAQVSEEDGPAVAPDAVQVPAVADAVPAAVQLEGLVLTLVGVLERRRDVAPGPPAPATERMGAARRRPAAVGGSLELLGALSPT